MRHAEAQNVNIKIKLENSEIVLKIKDDGKGIKDTQKDKNKHTFGVFGMKERANSLGGKLKIDSNIKKGTLVKLTLPYKQKQETT
jgi:two-component system sensor histidine kinase DegS